MPEYDLTIDEYEAVVTGATALYEVDIELGEAQRSLEPEQMKVLHDTLVRLGQIESHPEFEEDDDV